MELLMELLKKKGKYDEWNRLGGYYGQVSNTIRSNLFDSRNYAYLNMDDKMIQVSTVSSIYDDRGGEVINIPVFMFVSSKCDDLFVTMDDYKIVDKDVTLTTRGIATCCGVVVYTNDKTIMAHISPTMNTVYLLNDLYRIKDDITNIKLYRGILYGYQHSFNKALNMCNKLGLDKYDIFLVDMMDTITT
jgi:hypothetical protein